MQIFEQKSCDFLPIYGNINLSKIFLPRVEPEALGCIFSFYLTST